MHRIDIDTYVAQAEMGDLHLKDDVASSTLVFKHLLHAVPVEKLKKVLLLDITSLSDPNVKTTVVTPAALRTLKPKESNTRKSSQKRNPPQTLDMTQPAPKRRANKGGGRGR